MDYNIEALKRKMLVKYPFFGSVITGINYIDDENISLAATNGETIYYNSKALKGYPLEEQIFVFAHEVCHIAFNHIPRGKGKNQNVWNIATDAVINQFLKNDGLSMIKGCIDMPDAVNYNAEDYYEKLLKDNKMGNDGSNNNNSQKNSENKPEGHDDHSLWDKNLTKSSKLPKEIKDTQDKFEKIGEKEAFKKNKEEKKKQLEELKESLSKQVSQFGNTPGDKIRKVDDIGEGKPLLDWRYILKETINYDVDWSYKNATFEDGILTPSLELQPIPETEIVLDTSGSIDDVLLKNFLKECKNILGHSKVKVGCFDTKFYGFTEIKNEENIENMKFMGGGGTNFNVAVNAFTNHVDNKIIFTDGCADMPKKPMNAIWIVFGSNTIYPKGGRVIKLSDEQLTEMYSKERKKRRV